MLTAILLPAGRCRVAARHGVLFWLPPPCDRAGRRASTKTADPPAAPRLQANDTPRATSQPSWDLSFFAEAERQAQVSENEQLPEVVWRRIAVGRTVAPER
jgi:hypothetical protein